MTDAHAFPEGWREDAARAARVLAEHDRFLVCAHARLDGDALSSMAAAGFLLRALGREFVLYAPQGVPQHLAFLELPGHVESTLGHLPFDPEVVLALDCNQPSRLGETLAGWLAERGDMEVVNIDHHVGPGMGTLINVVRPEAAATTQVLASVIRESGVEVDARMAQALLLGLTTDTGCFRHSNCTAPVMALAAWLIARGASLFAIRERLDKNWTLNRLRLWGRLAARVTLVEGGRAAYCHVTLDDLRETMTTSDDVEGFVERMRDIRGVLVSVVLREAEPCCCRLSARSSEEADVRAMAASFGGGGHVRAAGATLRMPLSEASEAVLAAIHATLSGTP